MPSEALLDRRRRAAERRLSQAKQPEAGLPYWVVTRLKAFTYVPGQERLVINPARYRGFTPVLDSFDDSTFPAWNLREAIAASERFAALRQSGQVKAAAKQEQLALDRFLHGPLPRQQLVEVFGVSKERLLNQAKRIGAWVRVRSGEETPYEATIRQRLGQELGDLYLAEVAAESAAQEQLMSIEFATHHRHAGDHIGPAAAGWTLIGEPFRAWRKPGGGKLAWWAEVSCAAPGCVANRIQVRILDDLRKSKAAGCRWCRSRYSSLLTREKDLAWEQAFVPLVLREPARQFTYPLRAQGSLALLQQELAAVTDPPDQPAAEAGFEEDSLF